MLKYAIGAVLLVSFGAPALAQTTTTTTTTEQFYVVQDPSTKRCTVVNQRPTAGTTTTVVGGDGTVYKSRTEAETALKSVTVCTSQ